MTPPFLSSPYADIDIPSVTLYELLLADLSDPDHPDRDVPVVIHDSTGERLTYGELKDQVDSIAAWATMHGLGAGSTVAMALPNVPQFLPVFHGFLRAGAAITTVNVLYTSAEIDKQLRLSGAQALITYGPLSVAAREAASSAGVDTVILALPGDGTMGGPEPAEQPGAAEDNGMLRLTELLALDPTGVELAPAGDPVETTAVIPFSSGTTGLPKGVVLTQHNLVANILQTRVVLDEGKSQKVLAMLPFFHIYGMTVLLNLSLIERSTLLTMPKFDLEAALRIMEQYRCTYAYIAPPVAVALAKHPIVDTFDLSSLQLVFSGAAPLDGDLGEAVQRRLGCSVRQGYGMSETSPVALLLSPTAENPDLSSVGQLVANSQARVVDPGTGYDVDVPEDGSESARGELWLRGPHIMKGYLNNPEATAATLDEDGFLHTGDVATVTADGVFRIVDRLKELIKYKGYQVAPAELEAVLLTHPGIADAACVGAQGIGEYEGEEVPKAFVVRQVGAVGEALTAEEVMEFVASRVAPYKKVRLVEFTEAIPKSGTGKILRKNLR